MEKQVIINEITNYLSQQEEVVFAYLFGSFVEDAVYRDIDIAIYTSTEIDLIELGKMNTEIESQIHREIDLIELNGLPNKNPTLAYDIVTNGELLLNREAESHTRFKKQAWLYYFDTSKLRKLMDQSFSKRVESNKFGQRDYE